MNSEYLACGSETNDVFAYQKVIKCCEEVLEISVIQILKDNILNSNCRPSRNQQHCIDLVLIQKKGRTIQVLISLVPFAGKAIVQQC